jgi:drug/metabolite transporter (DMT)-like permease
MPTPRTAWLGTAIVLLAATLFGFLGVTSRWAYEAGVQPFAFVAWRAGVGAIGTALVVAALRGPGGGLGELLHAPIAARRGVLLGVLLAAGVNLSMFLAFDRTTVALALLGFYTYPAMVAAGSAVLGRERLDLSKLVALGLALAGMVAVVIGGLHSSEAIRVDPLGIALGLAAGGFQTAFVLTSRRFASVAADTAMAAILAGSSLVAAVLAVVTGGVAALTMPLGDPSVLALLAAVGLFAAAVPSTLFLTGVRWIGPVRTGILMLFEPVVGVGLAAVLLGESLEPVQAIGGGTILLAALIVQRASPSRTEVPAVAPAPGGP